MKTPLSVPNFQQELCDVRHLVGKGVKRPLHLLTRQKIILRFL